MPRHGQRRPVRPGRGGRVRGQMARSAADGRARPPRRAGPLPRGGGDPPARGPTVTASGPQGRRRRSGPRCMRTEGAAKPRLATKAGDRPGWRRRRPRESRPAHRAGEASGRPAGDVGYVARRADVGSNERPARCEGALRRATGTPARPPGAPVADARPGFPHRAQRGGLDGRLAHQHPSRRASAAGVGIADQGARERHGRATSAVLGRGRPATGEAVALAGHAPVIGTHGMPSDRAPPAARWTPGEDGQPAGRPSQAQGGASGVTARVGQAPGIRARRAKGSSGTSATTRGSRAGSSGGRDRVAGTRRACVADRRAVPGARRGRSPGRGSLPGPGRGDPTVERPRHDGAVAMGEEAGVIAWPWTSATGASARAATGTLAGPTCVAATGLATAADGTTGSPRGSPAADRSWTPGPSDATPGAGSAGSPVGPVPPAAVGDGLDRRWTPRRAGLRLSRAPRRLAPARRGGSPRRSRGRPGHRRRHRGQGDAGSDRAGDAPRARGRRRRWRRSPAPRPRSAGPPAGFARHPGAEAARRGPQRWPRPRRAHLRRPPRLPPGHPGPPGRAMRRASARRDHSSSVRRRLIRAISSTNRRRSGCSRSRIASMDQWRW